MSRALRVVACSRPVFNSRSHAFRKRREPISLRYVDDALAASLGLSHRDRVDYFEANGIDYDMVERYYEVVHSLNESYRRSPSGMEVMEVHFEPLRIMRFLLQLLKTALNTVLHESTNECARLTRAALEQFQEFRQFQQFRQFQEQDRQPTRRS